jgi:hypothetical protein
MINNNYNEYNNIKKLEESREVWIKHAEGFSKKAAYAELDVVKLNRLLDDMAYVLDLLVDGPAGNRVWFKVKEVLDKYEKYKREQRTGSMVDLPNKQIRKGKQGSA